MKKKVIIFIVIVAVLLVGFMSLRFVKGNWGSNTEEKDTYDLNIDILNESYPTDIVVYGEDIPFREKLIVRKIDGINENTLKTDKERQIIILSDLDGTLDITDNELLLIKNKIDNYECDFYYLGTDLKDTLQNLKFIDGWPADDYCVALFNQNTITYQCYGVWTESDKQATDDNRESLGHVLVSSFVNVLKDDYQ